MAKGSGTARTQPCKRDRSGVAELHRLKPESPIATPCIEHLFRRKPTIVAQRRSRFEIEVRFGSQDSSACAVTTHLRRLDRSWFWRMALQKESVSVSQRHDLESAAEFIQVF